MYSTHTKRRFSPKMQNGKIVPLLKQHLLKQRAFSQSQPTAEPSYLPDGVTTSGGLTSPNITGEHVTMLVHEMRSPLCVILNVLNDCRKTQLGELQQERLTLALEEAKRLHRMTDEILTQARSVNKPAFNWQEVKLRDLISEAIDLTIQLPVAVDRQIALASIPPNIVLRGDRDKLKQVFLNLLANACEAVRAEQSVVIHCQLKLKTHQISIKIHNRGELVPAHLLSLLGHQRVTTKSSGNGLGLMIVKEIVAAHGGEFDIKSSKLTGTTAHVCLPLKLAD